MLTSTIFAMLAILAVKLARSLPLIAHHALQPHHTYLTTHVTVHAHRAIMLMLPTVNVSLALTIAKLVCLRVYVSPATQIITSMELVAYPPALRYIIVKIKCVFHAAVTVPAAIQQVA
jgi:hypothetical protein